MLRLRLRLELLRLRLKPAQRLSRLELLQRRLGRFNSIPLDIIFHSCSSDADVPLAETKKRMYICGKGQKEPTWPEQPAQNPPQTTIS
jgi:hypothetical protein